MLVSWLLPACVFQALSAYHLSLQSHLCYELPPSFSGHCLIEGLAKGTMTHPAHPFLPGQGKGHWQAYILATFGPVGRGQEWQNHRPPNVHLDGSSFCLGTRQRHVPFTGLRDAGANRAEGAKALRQKHGSWSP